MEAVTILNRGKAGDDAVEKALQAVGIVGPVERVDGGEVEGRVAAAAAKGASVVIVGGGDGTVSAAATALSGSKTALGVLPLGTLNHFARDLGIPADLEKAAALIAAGHRQTVDVAEVNGRTFVNNSAIGLYPLMVVDRESQEHRLGRSKRLAMLVASLRTLVQFHDQRLVLKPDGGKSTVDTPLLFVGNNDYRTAMPGAGRRETLDGGHLCVLVMRKKGVPGVIAAIARALMGRARHDDMIQIDGVERLKVESRRAFLSVSIDGETCRLAPPLDYRIRKGALTVIAPLGKAEGEHG